MKIPVFRQLNGLILFFLYVLIFWLPYSIAVIESCVITALILWIINRNRWVEWFLAKEKPSQFFLSFPKALKPRQSFLNLPIVIFLVLCIFSVLGSPLRVHSLNAFFSKTLEWFVIYFLVIEAFQEEKHIKIFLGIFLLTAFVVCLDSLLQFYITQKDLFLGRIMTRGGATASFHHANSLGGYLTFVLPATASLFFFLKKKNQLFFLPLVIIIMVWSLLLTNSRASWFSVYFGFNLLLFLTHRKLFLAFILSSLFLILFFYIRAPQEFKRQLRIDEQSIQQSVDWRLALWEDSLKMIKAKPWFGHGVNTYMRVFRDYDRVEKEGFIKNSPTYAHNCYIQMATEVGILGFFAFLWILGKLFKQVIKNILDDRLKDNKLRMISAGLISGIFAFLIHSFYDTNMYSLQLSSQFWFFVGILVVIDRLLTTSLDKKMV